MVASYLRFFIPFLLAFYVSGFTVIGPLSADVDRFNNVPANWTWSEGDPTKILIHLFVHSQEDICVFGKGNPVLSQNITEEIQKADEVNGKRNGAVIYQADKIGEYILCAYEDITRPGQKFVGRSIANSRVFSVSRAPVLQTTTLSPPSSSQESTGSSSSTESSAGSQNESKPSGGLIAGAVIGGVCLAGLFVAVFVVYRRMRYRRRVIAFHKERMAITPPPSNFGSADMTEKGYSIHTISSFGDGHPRSPQSFSTQNTLQPLRRPPL